MLIDRVAEIAKPYFPDFRSDALRGLIERLPPDEPTFAQVSQFANELQVEVGFRSGSILADFTYRASGWIETLIRIDNVLEFQFTKGASESRLAFTAGDQFIKYIASADAARLSLEQYWNSLVKVLNK